MVEAGEVKHVERLSWVEVRWRTGQLHVACHISRVACCMSYLARGRKRQDLAPVFPKRKQCIIYHFVMTDVVLKSGSTDTGAMNRRHLVAIHGGMTSGFEVVHGLLDHVMVRHPAQTRPRSLPSRFLSLACAFSLTLARCVQCTRHTRASHETFFFVLISMWLCAGCLLMSMYFMFFV